MTKKEQILENNKVREIKNQFDLFENNKLYSTKATLEGLGIGLSTLNALVVNGTLPVIRISTRIRKFRGSSLNKITQEQ